ncbi:MAG: chloride channel protein [Gammaproteobacteria bacterium]
MLEKIRLKLAGAEALPLLVLLGIVVGVFAALIIIAFRLMIETSQAAFLPQGNAENYEALSLTMRFLLPFVGALIIAALFFVFYRGAVPIGIVHVLERLAYHQANLPFRNFMAQFAGAAISIICGHSVGREGPGVHLGAAAGSFIGQWLKLPNNTLRILVACGASASIAASFNTPIAGVIFAMEVIVMEYTIAGFAPIMLSAVSGALLTQAVFGVDPVFLVPALKLATVKELAALLVMGLVIGSLAAAFIRLMRLTIKTTASMAYLYRMGLAGLLTGICAMVLPQVMGIGYDTMNAAITGELGIGLLVAIVVAKMLVTTISLGLGLPGGLIGPTLIVGAAAGGAIGIVAQTIMPNDVASVGFYAMLGMAAMMGATLQAPLAALMALLELTVNTNIILPGMLVVIVASLTSSHLFRQQGIFLMLLKERGLDFRNNPIAQALRRVGVSSIMSRSFVQAPHQVRRQEAQSLLQTEPEWIVIEKDNAPTALMPSVELVQYLTMNQQDDIDLLDIPGTRYDCMAVGIRDTLQTVLDRMEEQQQDVVYVGQQSRRADERYLIHGIVTRQMIETHYRYY